MNIDNFEGLWNHDKLQQAIDMLELYGSVRPSSLEMDPVDFRRLIDVSRETPGRRILLLTEGDRPFFLWNGVKVYRGRS